MAGGQKKTTIPPSALKSPAGQSSTPIASMVSVDWKRGTIFVLNLETGKQLLYERQPEDDISTFVVQLPLQQEPQQEDWDLMSIHVGEGVMFLSRRQ